MRDSNLPKKRGKNEPFSEPEAKPEARAAATQFSQAFAQQLSQLIHPAALQQLRSWLAHQDPHLRALAERILHEWLGLLRGHLLPYDQPRQLPGPRRSPN